MTSHPALSFQHVHIKHSSPILYLCTPYYTEFEMASTKHKKNIGKQRQTSTVSSSWKFPLDSHNYKILGIGAVVIAIGYALMSTGISDDPSQWNNPLAVTIAPILLAIGYCAIIPYGLLARKKNSEVLNTDSE
ncbi:MAG: DUF3098 domain-containing protein [Bacteroidetes bacterium]|nr:DUF3098 domain-containing protein [Bacteroidota bacterium]